MKKHVVLFISHSSNLLGAEQSLLYILKGINRDVFEPIVVCPKKEGLLGREVEKLGIGVESVPLKWWIGKDIGIIKEILKIPVRLYSILKLIHIIRKHKAELVYTNSIVVFEAAAAARLLRKPHVWHIREILQNNPDLNTILSMSKVKGIVYGLSSKVICISNAVKSAILSDTGCNPGKTKVIYNAVNTDSFRTTGESILRKELGMGPEVSLVAAVGYMEPRKGHEDLCRAVKILSERGVLTENIVFLFVGSGDEGYVSYLDKLIKQLDIERYIVFTGFKNNIPDVMTSIDLLVLPSWEEPFGRVVIEAMAAGKPVIATNAGGVPEIVLDGHTGIMVPPRDPDELSAALEAFILDKDLFTNMGKEGMKRVKERFDPGSYVRGIESVLLELLGEDMGDK